MQSKSTARLLEQIQLEMRPIGSGHIHLQDEKTKRTWRVNIEPFLIAQYVVTREVYALSGHAHALNIMNQPMTDVSWYDAIHFCNLLSELAGLEAYYTIHSVDEIEFHSSANGYRLPTEAEWQANWMPSLGIVTTRKSQCIQLDKSCPMLLVCTT
jgi:Sulfatase-modifying factor enzyme 1